MSVTGGTSPSPENPTFSSPKGYASTTLSVKSLGAKSYEPQPEIASVEKGKSPGTFAPKALQVPYLRTVGKPPASVGYEIRNPKTKSHTEIGRAMEELGISIEEDSTGNKTVNIPENLLPEDKTEELENQAEVLREMVSLAARYGELRREMREASPYIQDPSASAVVHSLIEECDMLINLIAPNKEHVEQMKGNMAELEARKKFIVYPAPARPSEQNEIRGERVQENSQTPQERTPEQPEAKKEQRRFEPGETVRLLDNKTNKIGDWKIVSLDRKGRKVIATLQQRERKSTLDVFTLRKYVEETKQFEEEQKAKNDGSLETKNRVSYPPLTDFFAAFNNNEKATLSWMRRWVDSGKIDEFRKEKGNVAISEARIDFCKRALPVYIEGYYSLKNISKERKESIRTSIEICVRVLTGIQNEEANNIENFVDDAANAEGNLKELENDLEQAKNPLVRIDRNATPSATLEKKTFLDVRSLWPRFISFEQKKGWIYVGEDGKPETLPTREWTTAHENINPVFEEYRKFMQEGNSLAQNKKVELYVHLIQIKNDLRDALIEKNLDAAYHEAERLKAEIETVRKDWEKVKEKLEKGYEDQKLQKELKERFKKTEEWLALDIKRFDELKGWNLSSENLSYFENLLEGIKKTRSEVESKTNESKATPELLGELESKLVDFANKVLIALDRLEKTNSNKGGPILRPVIGNARNKNQNIRLRDGRTVTVAEYQKELEDKKGQAHYEKQIEDTTSRQETEKLYLDAYKRNPEEFISLYTDKRWDPVLEKYVFIQNENLKKHPNRDILERILSSNNVDSWKSLADLKEIPKDKMETSLGKHRQAYTPSLEKLHEKDKEVFDKETREAQGEYLQSINDQNPGPIPETKLDKDNYQWKDMANLDQIPINDKAIPNEELKARQEQNQEGKSGRLEKALKAVGDVMAFRDKRLPPKWTAWAGVVLIAGAGAAYMAAKAPGGEQAPGTVAEKSANEEESKTWTKFMYELKSSGDPRYQSEFKDDITKLDDRALLMKYARSHFKGSNDPTRMRLALNWRGEQLLNDNTGNHFGHLSKEERSEFSKLWTVLKEASMILSGQQLQSTTFEDAIKEIKQKVAKKEQEAGKKA